MSGRGLDRLQQALDSDELPASWPADVCRNARCGYWERNNGLYCWHRATECGADVATSWPRTVSPAVVATEVSEHHNNSAMRPWLTLYGEAIEAAGFRIVRCEARP